MGQTRGLQNRSFHQTAYSARTTTACSPAVRAPLSKEECLGMVDYYRESFSTQATSTAQDNISPASPSLNSHQPGYSRPKALLSDPKIAPGFSSSNDHPMVTRLISILHSSECTHHEAFEAYSALPSPGIAYLSDDMRRLLFRRLSTIVKKNRDSALRYLSVVDDMKEMDLPLTEAEWNSAIAFCGQGFAHISAAEVEAALLTWKEMEQEACVKSGNVTFNILFDMAAKAGKFVLAEMVLKEMEARGLKMNRYARTGIIYYHGLKADGDGIRRAYRDFVEAGEIVDTVVMNCVIAALIQAGELPAAEMVYERMKRILAAHTGRASPSLNWKETRDLGRLLDQRARQFRKDPVQLQKVRDEQFLAPNLHTYAIFVEHHASKTGELKRITALLSEMQLLGVSMHGRIFLKLFKGFANHGGVRYTSWTSSRLESVWASFVQIVDKGVTDVAVQKWMVVWTVRAFQRCCGRDRTLEIWEELRKRWRPGSGDLEFIHQILWEVLKSESSQYS